MGELVWGAILAGLVLGGLVWPYWRREARGSGGNMPAVSWVNDGPYTMQAPSFPIRPLGIYDPWPPVPGQEVRLGIAGRAIVEKVTSRQGGPFVHVTTDRENMDLAINGEGIPEVSGLVDGSLQNLIDQVEKGEGHA